MLLREMFSPIGAPKDDQKEVDWLDDLHFYIDNNDQLLNKFFFPAVKRHKEHQDNPNVYKVYIRPLEQCKEMYCDEFKIDHPEEKFPKEKIIELAKRIAEEQSKFIEKGDYEAS
jgi:hypothetical protein